MSPYFGDPTEGMRPAVNEPLTLSVSDFHRELHYLMRARFQSHPEKAAPVTITRNGRPVAVIVPFREQDAENPQMDA